MPSTAVWWKRPGETWQELCLAFLVKEELIPPGTDRQPRPSGQKAVRLLAQDQPGPLVCQPFGAEIPLR